MLDEPKLNISTRLLKLLNKLLMVDGLTTVNGVNVQKNVDQESKQERELAPILSQLVLEHHVLENPLKLDHARPRNAQLMEVSPHGVHSLSALEAAAAELKSEFDSVTTLNHSSEEKIAPANCLRPVPVAVPLAQSTVGTHRGAVTEVVVRTVEVEHTLEQDPAPTHLQLTEASHVLDQLLKHPPVIPILAQ